VVGALHLDEQVEAPRRGDDVVDLAHAREVVDDRLRAALHPQADRGAHAEAERVGIGHRHDADGVRAHEPRHALAHRALRESHDRADPPVAATAVLLQLRDDRAIRVVEMRSHVEPRLRFPSALDKSPTEYVDIRP
jgi:hypothetical protein